VTVIIGISQDEFAAMPGTFDWAWLREHFPGVAVSMHRFIDKVRAETHGSIVGDLDITRIPLEVYRARNMTNRRWRASGIDHAMSSAHVFLLGDSPIGSPYFQSISLGLENAFFLAGHLANLALPMDEIVARYETFMYQQWLRVYMRTQMIKHNKDLLESVSDTNALLEKAARVLARRTAARVSPACVGSPGPRCSRVHRHHRRPLSGARAHPLRASPALRRPP
jgi:hypothetical protein